MNNYVFGALDVISGKPRFLKRSDGSSLPFDQDNRDCVQFLTDWKAGAEVLNADGSPAAYSDAAVRALGLEPTTGETP